MAKLKYYTEAQRTEARQIAMVEFQTKRKAAQLSILGEKCACGQADPDVLIMSSATLRCANCNQKQKSMNARQRLASRKQELENSRIAAWQQTL